MTVQLGNFRSKANFLKTGRNCGAQSAMDASDLAAAFEEALIGFRGQLVSMMLGKHEVEGALDRFRLGIGAQ